MLHWGSTLLLGKLLSAGSVLSARAEKAETQTQSMITIREKFCIIKNVMSYIPDHEKQEHLLWENKGAEHVTKTTT